MEPKEGRNKWVISAVVAGLTLGGSIAAKNFLQKKKVRNSLDQLPNIIFRFDESLKKRFGKFARLKFEKSTWGSDRFAVFLGLRKFSQVTFTVSKVSGIWGFSATVTLYRDDGMPLDLKPKSFKKQKLAWLWKEVVQYLKESCVPAGVAQ